MTVLKNIILFLFKGVLGAFELLLGFILVLLLYVIFASRIGPPAVKEIHIEKRKKISENHYVLGSNWIKKNEFGIWEMYIEGAPYERGLIYGELAKELIQKQEKIFVDQIENFVPSSTWQQLLRLMIGFYNRDLPNNIPFENQKEIYGVSRAFSDDYDYISSKYARILNYHAAHDIGHALNDYSMVGCTSFALKDSMSDGGDLLVGRNFDFFVGDEFAEEKILLFVKPDKGHAFVSYSWAGFTGVVSGLNDKGLSVTINAAKSDLPSSSKTPISILAREILQYAETLDEAIAIAKKRKTFVSETLLISSKKDHAAILIEKSPTKTGVYKSGTASLICSNHYQSKTFINDKINKDNIQESDSKYRYNRVNELLNQKFKFTPKDVAAILRDQLDSNNDTLGMGNPRAINQLIAHHSVVIQPERYTFYISTSDFQLGRFIGYDLSEIFLNKKIVYTSIIDEDPFIGSAAYASFKRFKTVKNKISEFVNLNRNLELSQNDVHSFISSNSESYITYEMLGRYYLKKRDLKKAKKFFKIALTKEVASLSLENELQELIKECQK